MDDYDFVLGPVIAVKGLKGEVKIKNDCRAELVKCAKHALLKFKPQRDEKGKMSQRPDSNCTIGGAYSDKGTVILKLDQYPDRTAAETIIGASVHLKRTELAQLEDDEWYLTDLIGLDCFDTSGVHVGKVKDVEVQATTILTLDCYGKEAMVPFVKALVPDVDIKLKRLTINAIPGLLGDNTP